MSKKYYIVVGDVAEALTDAGVSIQDISNTTFKEIATIEYTEADFVKAFNSNTIVPAVQWLRIINTSST